MLSLLALVVSGTRAFAQDGGGEIVPETVPPDPTASSSPPPIVTEPPASTLPPGCQAPPAPSATFVGELIAIGPLGESGEVVARFRVGEVSDGTLDGFAGSGMVDIDFDRDVRFLAIGRSYLVAAQVDPERGLLVSKARVRPPLFGDNQVVGVNDGLTCPKFDDPVVARNVDGTPIDVGVLSPLLSNRRKVGLAFARPAAVAFGALLGLVVLKHVIVAIGRQLGRLSRRAGRWRRERAAQPHAVGTTVQAGGEGSPEPRPTRESSLR